MDELTSCIEELKSRIKMHRGTLSENESRTRAALIDPLLRTLGWDVSDPELVTPEYSTGKGRVDYALLKEKRHPVAIFEAKKLGESLSSDNHRDQMIGYAIKEGIVYAGLTNGNDWELYDVFEKVALNQKRILDISIEKSPTYHAALQLLCLWRPNLSSGNVTEALIPIVGLPDDKPPPRRKPSKDWVSLADYETESGMPSPSKIRFWNGTEKNFKSWRNLLGTTIELLYEDGYLTKDCLPYAPLETVGCVVNTEPKHIHGASFVSHYKTEIPFFININLNANDIRVHCRKLLEDFGKDPKTDMHLKIA